MTKEERQEAMAKARAARKFGTVELTEDAVTELKTKPVIAPQRYGVQEEDEVISVGKPVFGEEEYNGFVIVTESNGKGARVIVTQDGLHRAEWKGELAPCLERAYKFADTGDSAGCVNVHAYV